METLPSEPSVAIIQDWVRSTLFARWFANPTGAFPLARIPDADAVRIGAQPRVAAISAETAAKQKAEHPELSILEYATAQRVIDQATEVIQDGPASLIYILAETGAGGQVLVVKATRTGRGLFITSFRRLSADPAVRERTLRQLRRKEEE